MKVSPKTDSRIQRLHDFAGILIPGSSAMPAATDIAEYSELLRVSLDAFGYASGDVDAAINSIPHATSWQSAQVFAEELPQKFHIVSTLVSAAYFMSPEVLKSLNFPVSRQHPAEVEDFVEEYETGILNPVTDRGPRVRYPDEG